MNKLTLQEKAHKIILDKILRGNFKPGGRLREQHLAEELEMSPTPIREAFRRLEREGWVEFIPRCGVCLKTISVEDVEDIYAIREGLEISAIDLAIKRSTVEDLKLIKKTVDTYREDCEKLFNNFKSDKKIAGPVNSDIDFHLALMSATHSQKFYDFTKTLNLQVLYVSIHAGVRFDLDYQQMMKTAYEHANIYNALCDKEVKLAEELLRSHIRRAKARIISVISNNNLAIE